ncbi:MAG: hypothetical protein H0U18_03145 [Pyrinomonadaceae bacterium]|nr:hypothetical protein [Pyrinomonadaceae bacterium]
MIAVIRKKAKPSPTSTPVSSPPQPKTTPESTSVYQGLELVGLNETGVTARVRVSQQIGFSGNALILRVENTSETGTITNIGFLIKNQGAPNWATKIEDEKGVTGPGIYRLTKDRWEINTRDFKAVSAYGLVTSRYESDDLPSSFYDGFVNSGIPPGKSTLFSITSRGGVFDPRKFERGLIVRFQGIGEEDRVDIAMYPKLDVLLPSATDPSVYEIERIKKNN